MQASSHLRMWLRPRPSELSCTRARPSRTASSDARSAHRGQTHVGHGHFTRGEGEVAYTGKENDASTRKHAMWRTCSWPTGKAIEQAPVRNQRLSDLILSCILLLQRAHLLATHS
jgi:hypothetical protein